MLAAERGRAPNTLAAYAADLSDYAAYAARQHVGADPGRRRDADRLSGRAHQPRAVGAHPGAAAVGVAAVPPVPAAAGQRHQGSHPADRAAPAGAVAAQVPVRAGGRCAAGCGTAASRPARPGGDGGTGAAVCERAADFGIAGAAGQRAERGDADADGARQRRARTAGGGIERGARVGSGIAGCAPHTPAGARRQPSSCFPAATRAGRSPGRDSGNC